MGREEISAAKVARRKRWRWCRWRRRCRGARRGGCAGGLRGVIGGDGLRLAEAAGRDGGGRDALLGEKITHGIGAAFGKLLIEIVAADAVRVTLDLERKRGMR